MFSKSRFNTRMMDSKCFLWVCLRTSCFFVISRRHWVMKPIGGACRCWWTSSCSFPPLSCVVWMRWVHSKSMRRPLLLGVRFLDHIMPYHAARNVFVSRCIKWISEESRFFFFMCIILTSQILELCHNSHIPQPNMPNMPQFLQGDGDAGADDGRSGNSCWVQLFSGDLLRSRGIPWQVPTYTMWKWCENDVKSKDWSIYHDL